MTRESTFELLRYGELQMDLETTEVWRDGRPIRLTPGEFTLLEFFVTNPRKVFSHEEIHERVWGVDLSRTSNCLNQVLSNLRKKLGPPVILHTIHSVGIILK